VNARLENVEIVSFETFVFRNWHYFDTF
jgi:hypothetical protein